MSTPVLLVINSDTCEPCRKLICDQSNINENIKASYPNIRTIWCCLDKTDLTILPKPFDTSLIHVPIVLYFANDSWSKYISGGGIMNGVYVFDNEIMPQYGSAYTSDTILKWLKDVTEVEAAFTRLETVQINNVGEKILSKGYDGEHCIQYYDCCGEPIACPECGSHNVEIVREDELRSAAENFVEQNGVDWCDKPQFKRGVLCEDSVTIGGHNCEDEYVLLPLVDDSNIRSCIYDECVLPKVLPKSLPKKCGENKKPKVVKNPNINSTQILEQLVHGLNKDYISVEMMLEGNLITLGFDSKSNTLKFGMENSFGKTKTSVTLW